MPTMPIHVSWGNEQKTYTFFRFENKWNWEEYHEAIAAASRLVNDCPHSVNVLVDVTECRLFPQNLLSNVRSSVTQHAHETDLVVIVTTSGFVEMLVRTLEKISGRQRLRLQVARTLQNGRHILEEHERLHPVSLLAPDAVSESAPAPAEPTSLPE
jgi:ABC-type phosphate/phosphonate transport system ATPase subunit